MAETLSPEAGAERIGSGFLRSRVVQVHPTLRCNLACAHCYSESAPGATDELSPASLITRLEHLRAEGYEVVSFSGGEPLVYRGLEDVARSARSLGFRVNLISNGLLLTRRRLERLADLVDLLGISVDGTEARHDGMRGAGTFARLMRRLEGVQEAGILHGIAHCVTHESIADLPWLLELCMERGARLLQLHPLTLTGRAARECGSLALTSADMARLHLIARLLQIEAGERVLVQLDLATTRQVLAGRDRYRVLGDDPSGLSLSEMVNPVVLDERGRLWPLAYGMASHQCLAAGGNTEWESALAGYKRSGAAPLRRLLTGAFDSLSDEPGQFVDWYGYLVHRSHRSRPAVAASLTAS